MKEINVEKLYQLAGNRALELESALNHLADLLADNFQLKVFFEDTGVRAEHKILILKEVYPTAPVILQDLLKLLIANDLMSCLNWLQRKFRTVVSHHTGTQVVEIVSVTPLSQSQKERLSSFLGAGNRLRFRLRSEVIGGIEVRWEDGRYLDATLAGALKQLEVELLV